jgi:hypothetical protein
MYWTRGSVGSKSRLSTLANMVSIVEDICCLFCWFVKEVGKLVYA